jgi:hypothetical protein
MTTTTTLPWNQLLLDQLEHHWVGQLRPRLDGLTDDEYLWEPARGLERPRRRRPDDRSTSRTPSRTRRR